MRLPILLFCMLGSASAAVITVTDSTPTLIPDGNSSGVVRSLVVADTRMILSAEVDLDIASVSVFDMFLGDLYFYIQHDTDISILTNRAGRRAGAPAGYDDDQRMTVTFSTLATNDIHNYRLSVTGSQTTPLSGALTGTWQPDGRALDPAVVLDTSPRTAGLDVFSGDSAAGTWNLFAADLSTGAVHQINSWTLRLDVIPEPGSVALMLSALALSFRRRR